MNNQKLTKLNTKDIEIKKLQKENNFLKKHLESVNQDKKELENLLSINKALQDHLAGELKQIKTHWLYKLIKLFKKWLKV